MAGPRTRHVLGGGRWAQRSAIAVLGGLVERFLFRHLYGKEELYQLLFTYALVLVLSDVAKIMWGTQQKSVSRPPGLTGSVSVWGATIPYYNLFILLLGPALALAFWFVLQRTRAGRLHPGGRARSGDARRARRQRDAPLYRRVRAGLLPRRSRRRPGDTGADHRAGHGHRDHRGGLRGRGYRRARLLLGDVPRIAVIYGQVLSFGILFFPRFSIFSVFALMAAVLIIRPWGLLGRPLK